MIKKPRFCNDLHRHSQEEAPPQSLANPSPIPVHNPSQPKSLQRFFIAPSIPNCGSWHHQICRQNLCRNLPELHPNIIIIIIIIIIVLIILSQISAALHTPFNP
jgi:hypothetical protein